ncbi:MAG TPA: STAS domain-containing protein [Actinomycetota bacterium]
MDSFQQGGHLDLMVDHRTLGGWRIVGVAGELDLLTAPSLRTRLIEAIDQGDVRLVLDLSHVSFLDSSGLGALIAGYKRVRERGGRLVLVATSRAVLNVLSLTGLDGVFQVFPTVDEALATARS